MTKTVRLPEDLHEELKARRRTGETMADTIARYIRRPHPADTREALTGAEATAVEAAIDDLYDEDSDRLDRVRSAFDEGADEG